MAALNRWLSNLIGTKLTSFWIGRALFDSSGLSANRTFTLPDASGTLIYSGGALGTPSSGTLTNCTFPTLNQNTTGSAATLTTTRTIGGSNFNGSANVTSFPSPGAIGGATPAAGTFTTLVAGSATSLLVGTAGSAVGSVGFRNATSGTITLQPTTGALGTVTITLPATTGTVYVSGGTDVAVADGGTGASTAVGARAGLGFVTLNTTGTSGTVTIDVAGDNVTHVLSLTGNVTLALSNEADGRRFTLFVRGQASGYTITWFSGIKWAGGAAPTIPTTSGRVLPIGFIRLASGEWLGIPGSECY